MLRPCTSLLNQPIKFELAKPAPELTPTDNASRMKGSIIPVSSIDGIKKPMKFQDIPFEKLITIAELLK